MNYLQAICLYVVIGLLIGYFAYTQMNEKKTERERVKKASQMGAAWPLVVLSIITLLIESFTEWVFGIEDTDDEEW